MTRRRRTTSSPSSLPARAARRRPARDALLARRRRSWLALRPLAALDTVDGLDETLAVSPPRDVDGSTFDDRAPLDALGAARAITLDVLRRRGRAPVVRARARRADRRAPARLVARCFRGQAARVHAERVARFERSSRRTRRDPRRPPAGRRVGGDRRLGDGEPGRGHWLFTPAPLYLASRPRTASRAGAAGDVARPRARRARGRARLRRSSPTSRATAASRCGSSTRGTRASTVRSRRRRSCSRRASPIPTRASAGIATTSSRAAPRPRRSRARRRRGGASRSSAAGEPSAASRVEGHGDRRRPTRPRRTTTPSSTQLEQDGVVPGTVVLDDKWQADVRHERAGHRQVARPARLDRRPARARAARPALVEGVGSREGLDPELCIRNPDGEPVGLDPIEPGRARAAARERACGCSRPNGLDADGLKVDFTARTPSGPRARAGTDERWGIALLHELLATVYTAAKEAKPDALVMTHTPHPAFVDVTDMIRLNDMIGGVRSVVPQMRHRAQVARAACPELLIDTDDWRVPQPRGVARVPRGKAGARHPVAVLRRRTWTPRARRSSRRTTPRCAARGPHGRRCVVSLDATPARRSRDAHPVTLADIAREAGTSASTASRALSGRGYVSRPSASGCSRRPNASATSRTPRRGR